MKDVMLFYAVPYWEFSFLVCKTFRLRIPRGQSFRWNIQILFWLISSSRDARKEASNFKRLSKRSEVIDKISSSAVKIDYKVGY